jgi:hypothetical protein
LESKRNKKRERKVRQIVDSNTDDNNNNNNNNNKVTYGRLCDLVVRVPGYRTEMYCVSCEVRTEFIYVM